MNQIVKQRLSSMYVHYHFTFKVLGIKSIPTLKHRLMVSLLDVLENPPRAVRKKDRRP